MDMSCPSRPEIINLIVRLQPGRRLTTFVRIHDLLEQLAILLPGIQQDLHILSPVR
jgi:hypothetical protein